MPQTSTELVIAVGLAVGATLAASPASGAIVYLTQQRSISASGFVNAQPEGGGPLSATGFGDFNRIRMHTFSSGAGSVTASQNSRLLPEQILMDGAAQVTVLGGAEMDGTAYSRFEVSFRLDAATPFRVDQSHVSQGDPALRLALARLTGPSGVVFEWREEYNHPSDWPVGPVFGTLSTGDYTLRLETFVVRGTDPPNLGTTNGGVSFAMTIPNAPSALAPLLPTLACARRQRRGGR